MRVINNFKNEYDFLSNFYICNVEYNGILYSSTEAAFQAQKTLENTERKYIATLTPSESKKACNRYGLNGFKIKLRSDWEEVKDQAMYEAVKEKFKQNSDLKERLLNTGDAILIEGNRWHDNYWGNCTCDKCKNITGRNQLGLTLMKVREELRTGVIE